VPALPDGSVAGDLRDLAAPGLSQAEEESEATELNATQEERMRLCSKHGGAEILRGFNSLPAIER